VFVGSTYLEILDILAMPPKMPPKKPKEPKEVRIGYQNPHAPKPNLLNRINAIEYAQSDAGKADAAAALKEAAARSADQERLNLLAKTGREDPNSSVSQYLQEAALKKEADKKEAKEARRIKKIAKATAKEAKAACAEVDGVAVDEASVLLSAMFN